MKGDSSGTLRSQADNKMRQPDFWGHKFTSPECLDFVPSWDDAFSGKPKAMDVFWPIHSGIENSSACSTNLHVDYISKTRQGGFS